jgi:hypothetical protein
MGIRSYITHKGFDDILNCKRCSFGPLSLEALRNLDQPVATGEDNQKLD